MHALCRKLRLYPTPTPTPRKLDDIEIEYPGSAHSQLRARSFDLEVAPWAPTRLTSCISRPGPEECSGASTLPPGPAQQFRRHKLSLESARKPLLHTRGISKARSFDLEVTPWAPARLTSCIFHPGLEEGSGVSTVEPGPAQLLQTTFA